MKVNETRSRPTGRVTAPSSVRSTKEAGTVEAASTPDARPINDSLSIMGIPETELTPKVREALMALMAEV
jgi:hypothetical protein